MANRLTGRIFDLNVQRDDIAIQLDNMDAEGPKDNVFLLKADHGNRNALYALALAAAAHRWRVTIRIAGGGEITSTETAEVGWLAVRWN